MSGSPCSPPSPCLTSCATPASSVQRYVDWILPSCMHDGIFFPLEKAGRDIQSALQEADRDSAQRWKDPGVAGQAKMELVVFIA
eukprot:6297224-Pyramimonas_sp.AAC.2